MRDPFAPLDGGAGASSAKKKTSDWAPIMPVPDDAPSPPAQHPQLGEPTVIYTYRAADGHVNGYVLRFDSPSGKEIRPLTYCVHSRGVRDWRWLTWREHRWT
jgi:putative DNA primase/helicase